MNRDLMRAAWWRFRHKERDVRRIVAWTLVVCMTLATAASFWQPAQEEYGASVPPVVTYQETPTVLIPAQSWTWGLYTADSIEHYLASIHSPLAGRGLGAAIMRECNAHRYRHAQPGGTAQYMILRPDVVLAIILHESNAGANGFSKAPYNNPLSYNVTDSWRTQDPATYSFSSLDACLSTVMEVSFPTYLNDGGSHSHGPSLEGLAVHYVGHATGQTDAQGDAQWVAGVTMWITRYQAYAMSEQQRAFVAMLSSETMRPAAGSADYLDRPLTRRELAILLYRQHGGK